MAAYILNFTLLLKNTVQSEKLHRVIAYTLFLIDHKIAVEEGDYL